MCWPWSSRLTPSRRPCTRCGRGWPTEQATSGLSFRLDVERGEPTQRAIELAYLNDLIVLDRGFNRHGGRSQADSRRATILKPAHGPVLFAPVADQPPARKGLLVHDTRRKFDEAVFLAAYLAEQWHLELVVLPIGNGRNTAGVTTRVRDYLALHEVSAPFLEPARATHPGRGYPGRRQRGRSRPDHPARPRAGAGQTATPG
ncbi:MAG: hypothetical protein IPH95_21160 [Candidatus Promineofilum sp.]|nr:hypothetical protein [Promineifilum sp.]